MNRIFILFSILFSSLALEATHNRAGEITYRWLGGLEYEVTITTYTRYIQGNNNIDRCSLTIDWGDGSSEVLYRVNGVLGICGGVNNVGDGEQIEDEVRMNKYVGTHTYATFGSYILSFEDLNRNGGVVNIPGSIGEPFYVQTELYISTSLGENSSPILTNPPIDQGCVDRRFEHNPGAYDPDGDSLVYRLTNCRGANGNQFLTTYDPQYVQDPVQLLSDGTLVWDSPKNQGEFNFAIEVIEFRKNDQGQWVRLGTVTRDLQVNIGSCYNQPPEIEPAGPFCVRAGDTLNFTVWVKDDKDTISDNVTVTAFGGPFEVANPADGIFMSGPPALLVRFNWETACNHIQEQPYQVVFRAEDYLDADPLFYSLSDVETVLITVVGPEPLNPLAQVVQRNIELNWDTPVCEPEVLGYRIYRREGFYGFSPDECEIGVPAYTGYVEIAEVQGSGNTTYLDTGEIKQGLEYCYMVTALYGENLEGFASEEACVALPLTMPMMTKVDVRTTSTTNGAIEVDWMAPPELDSNVFPPPYGYNLYRANGITGSDYTFIQSYVGLNSTGFIDTMLNTDNEAYNYLVSFISDGDSVGNSDEASSIFIEVKGSDMQNIISMESNTPWANERYVIYRESPTGSGSFDSLGVTTTRTFVDTGLINGELYCYYAEGIGRFTASDSLPYPLLNRSQIECGRPIDTIAPCAPTLAGSYDCAKDTMLVLTWQNSDDLGCGDDIVFYNLYFKENADADFPSNPILGNILGSSINISEFGLPEYGCYALQAADDADNNGSPNLSVLSQSICFDPCPKIEFPNIFSPNGDGYNDFFWPISFEDVGDISVTIHNRNGNMVYSSTSIEEFVYQGWDGKDQTTGMDCSGGVYFYVFKYLPSSFGEGQQETIKGFFHLVR